MKSKDNHSLEIRLNIALLNLLETNEFNKVSVKAICKNAKINRTTFYTCFDSKGDLLHFTCEQFFSPFMQQFDENIRLDEFTFKASNLKAMQKTQKLLPLFNRIIHIKGINFSPEKIIYKSVRRSLLKKLSNNGFDPTLVDYYAGDFASNLIYTLKWWLTYPALTPDQVSKVIYTACFKGLNNILKK